MVHAMSLSSHREARPARFLSLHPSFLSPMSSGAGHLHLESVSLPLFPLSFAPLFPSLLARHIRSTRLSISFSLARSLSISIHTHTPIKDSSSLQTNLHEAYHLFRDADGYITPDRRARERWARASERDWRERAGGKDTEVWMNRDGSALYGSIEIFYSPSRPARGDQAVMPIPQGHRPPTSLGGM